MIRGKELAEAVLKHVISHPESHNQATWVASVESPFNGNPVLTECGTRACLAGWTVLLSAENIHGRHARHVLREVAAQAGVPGSVPSWEETALALLFPGLRPGPSDWYEDHLDASHPAVKTQRAFHSVWDDNDAIELFAEAFGIDTEALREQ